MAMAAPTGVAPGWLAAWPLRNAISSTFDGFGLDGDEASAVGAASAAGPRRAETSSSLDAADSSLFL